MPLTDAARIIATPAFTRASAILRRDHDRFVEDIVALTEIPAPPFKEARRAEIYRDLMIQHGLHDVKLDGIGNVTGLRPGKAPGRKGMVVASAHLDTVFPEGTDTTVRREGTKLFAPGVGDDTRGLAALLAFMRALDAAGIETAEDILFVADVGEEGQGDLRGIRHLFTEGEYRYRIGGFFTFDGPEMGKLVTSAIGSHRYRVTFRGPGGHSLNAFGTVSPAYAMAALVAGMGQIVVPETPRTTFSCSVFGGGSSINAIPEEVWVEIDLRSASPEELAKLDARMRALVEEAVAAENARRETRSGSITAEVKQIGNRPAGATPEDAPIVEACKAALRAHGLDFVTAASSTDANIPMSLGIPAVMIGTGGHGDRYHSVDEWIDVEPEASSKGLSTGLAALIAVAGLLEG